MSEERKALKEKRLDYIHKLYRVLTAEAQIDFDRSLKSIFLIKKEISEKVVEEIDDIKNLTNKIFLKHNFGVIEKSCRGCEKLKSKSENWRSHWYCTKFRPHVFLCNWMDWRNKIEIPTPCEKCNFKFYVKKEK